MYLITYFCITDEIKEDSETVKGVNLNFVKNFLCDPETSKPARVSLMMTLAQDYFTAYGWGSDVTNEYFDSSFD